jgi:hypothetical protein
MRSRHATALIRACAVLLGATMVLTGCVTTSGGPPGELQRALQRADSAAFTVQVSFRQLQAGRTLPTTAETTCENMLEQAQTAQNDASTVSVDDAAQHAVRARVAQAIAATASLIVSVQDYLAHNSTASAHRLLAQLGSNRRLLAALHRRLGSSP